jgi:hypothetical protein
MLTLRRKNRSAIINLNEHAKALTRFSLTLEARDWKGGIHGNSFERS